MNELADDRAVVCAALQEHGIEGWAFELHAEARPTPVRSAYLEEVADSDVYIGLFYKTLGRATVEEFEYASRLGKPALIFEKVAPDAERSPELNAFLANLNGIDTGVTVRRYQSSGEDLARLVKGSIAHLLAEVFHSRFPQSPLPAATTLIHPDELNALAKLRNAVVILVSDGLRSPLALMHGLEPERVTRPGLVSPAGAGAEPVAQDEWLPEEQRGKQCSRMRHILSQFSASPEQARPSRSCKSQIS
jgi:hypothetical protein